MALDAKGRTVRLEDNLIGTLEPTLVQAIRREVSERDGNETISLRGDRPNLHSAWSSAALAVNAFARWRGHEDELLVGGVPAPGALEFERKLPIGITGRAPNLEVLASDDRAVLAIESKCSEPLSAHVARFRPDYERAIRSLADRHWRAEYERLVAQPRRYRYLDAAQLVKHYLGLRKTHHGKDITLAYLFWEPRDAELLGPFATHRAELEAFSIAVSASKVRFVALSYPE